MKSFRLNRLFNPVSKRCIDVAVDHGFFNELNFLAGIEDLAKAVDVLVEANPDAIQLTVGRLNSYSVFPGNRNRRWFFAPTWQTSIAKNCPELSSAV
jgi:fructose-bisphosphate aldolase, class I